MVTLDDEKYEILQNLKGFGKKDAEKIKKEKKIIVTWVNTINGEPQVE